MLSYTASQFFKLKPKNIIAVTGTNGKTSIANFYYQILNLNNKKVASIGTLGVKSKKFKLKTNNTSIDPINIHKILKKLKELKIENVILEASSHGLKQYRLNNISFNTALFTNLSRDHLDYHKTFKDYLNSKLILFNKLLNYKGNVIYDNKIPQAKKLKFISKKRKLKNYNFDGIKSFIKILSIQKINDKKKVDFSIKNKKYSFKTTLIGNVQIKNLMFAIVAAYLSKIKINNILRSIEKIKPINGRLEKIGNIKNQSNVILDYAHTPEALKTAILNIKEDYPLSKISLVLGCGGNRDKDKRSMMGKIASRYCNTIYITDDNPRLENPKSIRNDIKKGINPKKLLEISDRKKAIYQSISDLNSGEIVLIAGKGHERTQIYKNKVRFFSDKEIILKSIKKKNQSLSKKLKLNIIKDLSNTKISFRNTKLRKVKINSKEVSKNDVFFALKGRKKDAHRYLNEVFKKQASLAIVNKINKKLSYSKQIKVKNTLNFLTTCSKNYRKNLNTKIVAITGSCGKTTLKEMIGSTLKKISKTTYSQKSFNNKYGVPLSLFNIKQNDDFGILEVGMDKKGEIDSLTKVIKPDLGIITNISYAHSKNFKNISGIANAKAEMINNIRSNGTIILNADDYFFNHHKKIALSKGLKVYSFAINNKFSSTKLIEIKKNKNKFCIKVKIENVFYTFFVENNNKSNLYNILATLTLINLLRDLKKLSKNVFLNFKSPSGRGNISKIKANNKYIFLVDETYNSNPLSLKTAIENFDKINVNAARKHLVLGDMLELGRHSLKQHRLISKDINKTKIHKVYVYGKYIRQTFRGLKNEKKAKILIKKSEIFSLINRDLNNNDYLMIKGSNATGLHKIINNLKQSNSNVI